jgi:hypothetical protein
MEDSADGDDAHLVLAVPLRNDPAGLGMTLSMSAPEPVPAGRPLRFGTVVCLFPPHGSIDHSAQTLFPVRIIAAHPDAHASPGASPPPSSSGSLVYTVVDADGGSNEREVHSSKIMGRPGSVFVSRFKRNADGKKGQAESGRRIRLFDRILSVDGKEAHDLSTVLAAIQQGGEILHLTVERSARLDALHQEQDAADKRAFDIEVALRVIFDAINAVQVNRENNGSAAAAAPPVSQDAVPLTDVMAAGNTVFRKAGIILPADKSLSELILTYLGDNTLHELEHINLTWLEFRDLFLLQLAGHCHAARTANARDIFDECDINGDGKLSLDEVQSCCNNPDSLLNRTYPFVGKELASHFSEVDHDGNGYLDRDEFQEALELFWCLRMHPHHQVGESEATIIHHDTDRFRLAGDRESEGGGGEEGEDVGTKKKKEKSTELVLSQIPRVIASPPHIESVLSHSALGIHPLESGELGTVSRVDLEANHNATVRRVKDAVQRGELTGEEGHEKIDYAMAQLSAQLEVTEMTFEIARAKMAMMDEARAAASATVLRIREEAEQRLEAVHRAEIAMARVRKARFQSEREAEEHAKFKATAAAGCGEDEAVSEKGGVKEGRRGRRASECNIC